MKKVIIIPLLLSLLLTVSGQTIDLTYTAVDNESYVQLDSIKVMNRTQGGDTVLYWPDTVLSLYYVGIYEKPVEENAFQVFQNYPNPVINQTTVSLYVPNKDKVSILVTDILGRMIIQTERVLDKGKHTFLFTPGRGNLCFFTARWQEQSSSIKVLQAGFHSGGTTTLEYTGSKEYSLQLKAMKDILDFSFSPGDELLYIGYTDTLQSGMLDAPEESTTYTFQFATNIPCPGTPTVEYEGQVYNTIQIFSQCWLKENLNIGVMITAPNPQTNNDTIEKYCMADMTYFCDIWGGLYFWDETMNYTAQGGVRGICPEGWHIPDELDWQILEGVADSEYGLGDPIWDNGNWRGFDAGGNLKQTGNEHWEPPNTGATDAFGFTALPGGYFVQGDFWGHNYKGIFWTSGPPGKYIRNMDWNEARVRKAFGGSGLAASIRCIKD